MSEAYAVRLQGVGKSFPMRPRQGRLHSLKGALLGGELWSRRRQQGGFEALADVSLEVGRGETFAVIGPNGSGKSTLLKVVAGILQPTSGKVEVVGRVTALIELGAGFHPEITGRENVIINGMMLGLSRAEVQRRLPWIIEFAGVGPFIDQPVKTFSSGMYVRLGFAVAVAADPEVLVIDEVLAVGDQAFAHKCLDRIAALQRRGTAILLVSHDLALVEQLSHRALYLQAGRPVVTGSSPAVVARYRSDIATEEAGQQTAGSAARWGNKEVELVAVEFLDPQGRVVGAVRHGEHASLRLSYEVHKPQQDFVFGVAIHREDGQHVFGTNTDIDGWRSDRLAGAGHVTLELPSLELAPGRYVVDAAVHAKGGLAYDYAREVCSFVVTAPSAWPGCYAPRHRWLLAGPAMHPPPEER